MSARKALDSLSRLWWDKSKSVHPKHPPDIWKNMPSQAHLASELFFGLLSPSMDCCAVPIMPLARDRFADKLSLKHASIPPPNVEAESDHDNVFYCLCPLEPSPPLSLLKQRGRA